MRLDKITLCQGSFVSVTWPEVIETMDPESLKLEPLSPSVGFPDTSMPQSHSLEWE